MWGQAFYILDHVLLLSREDISLKMACDVRSELI